MAGRGKTATDLGAWVCFEDESGRSLRPPIARTWAPRGVTPLIKVPARRAGRVNIAALACYRPGYRPRLIYRLRTCRRRRGEPKGFTWRDYRDLLTAAHHQLPGGKIVLTGISAPVLRPLGSVELESELASAPPGDGGVVGQAGVSEDG